MTDEIIQKHIEGLWKATAKHLAPLTGHLIETEQVDQHQLSYQLTRASRKEEAKKLIANGHSQREAAEILGVSPGTINSDVQKLNEHRSEPEQKEPGEVQRILEIQSFNREVREAKAYISKYYMPAREIAQADDDDLKEIIHTIRNHRYLLKVNVTPRDLRKAGEFLLKLAEEEIK